MTKGPLRALGLVVVVIGAVGCGSQLTGALKPKVTATPVVTPSGCPQAVYGKPCFTPGPSPTPSSIPLIGVSDVAFSDSLHGWAVGSSCVDSTQTCTLLADNTSNAGASWSRPISFGKFPEETSAGVWAPATLSIRYVGAKHVGERPGYLREPRPWVDMEARVQLARLRAGASWRHRMGNRRLRSRRSLELLRAVHIADRLGRLESLPSPAAHRRCGVECFRVAVGVPGTCTSWGCVRHRRKPTAGSPTVGGDHPGRWSHLAEEQAAVHVRHRRPSQPRRHDRLAPVRGCGWRGQRTQSGVRVAERRYELGGTRQQSVQPARGQHFLGPAMPAAWR